MKTFKTTLWAVVRDEGDGSATCVSLKNKNDAEKYAVLEEKRGDKYGYGFAESGLVCFELTFDLETGELLTPDVSTETLEKEIKEFKEGA